MPLAKIRSVGLPSRALRTAPWYRSFRLVPDQNSFSKSSVWRRTRFSRKTLRKMAAQLMMDTLISNKTTACTTQVASSMSWKTEKSWVMDVLKRL